MEEYPQTPGYVTVNAARNGATLTGRRVVIPSASTGTTGGKDGRERPESAEMSGRFYLLHIIFPGTTDYCLKCPLFVPERPLYCSNIV